MAGVMLEAVVLGAVVASFAVSATVGLGGSLLLVPTMVLALGPREGVAMAALLLAGNNVVKVGAYRASLPWRAAGLVVIAVSVGAFAGAELLLALPEQVVAVAVVVAGVGTFFVERRRSGAATSSPPSRGAGPALALAAGMSSGLSGMSGPLKGLALRSLGLDRRHLVGAASLASLSGDASKVAVYIGGGLLTHESLLLAVTAVPLMLAATAGGRALNMRFGEHGYSLAFWAVMGGYAVRLLL